MYRFILAMILSALSFAAGARILDDEKRLLQRNADVECQLNQAVLIESADGSADTYVDKDIFEGLKPKPSSSSDYATYSAEFENADFSFYYFMNSQVGEIRLVDKRSGFASESDLDLSDMEKEERQIGEARLRRQEEIQVVSAKTGQMISARRVTVLRGSCGVVR